jgi:hypothetical protein
MKRIYIALVLLAIIAVSCVSTLLLERKQLHAMIDLTDKMEQSCRKGDYDRALEQAITLKGEFDERTKTFALFLRHNELNAIKETVLLLPLHLEQESYHEFYIDVSRCRLLLQKQWEMDLPILQNIF